MIVPPFFGLYLPYKEREVYGLKHSYLSNDILTYSAPTKNINLSYLTTDVLCYTIVSNPLQITWLSEDILSYSVPTSKLSLSYCTVDVLSYSPPPEVPLAPSFISVLEGDSLAYLNWSIPYNNRSPLIDYTIQFKPTTGNVWNTVNDGVNLGTGLTIDSLINHTPYQFRVAAINAVGTGSFVVSSIVIPSGGDDSYCNLKLLLQPDSTDVASVTDLSCNSGILSHIGIQPDSTNYVYGGKSLFFDGQIDDVPNPNQFPYFSTSNHLKITRNPLVSSNTVWSLSNDFTIELWIRPTVSTTTSPQMLVSAYSQQEFGYYNNYWKLYRQNNNMYFTAQTDYYSEENGQWIYDSLYMVMNNLNLSTQNFTHIAICRSLGYIRCYINGVEILKQYFTPQVPIYSDYLIIGADHTPYNSYYDIYNINRVYTFNPFIGNIDDILISRSAKYRRNFTPSRYDKTINCNDCKEPGQVTNLSVTVIDGVYN